MLHAVVIQVINQVTKCKADFLPLLHANIEAALCESSKASIVSVDEKLAELQKQLLKLANAKKDYAPIAEEIDRLQAEKQQILLDNAGRADTKQRVQDMMEYLQKQSTQATQYDEQLVRRLIEKVTVFDEKFVVEFKAGVEVEIRM